MSAWYVVGPISVTMETFWGRALMKDPPETICVSVYALTFYRRSGEFEELYLIVAMEICCHGDVVYSLFG